MFLTLTEEKTDDPLLNEEMLGEREDWTDRWKCISDQTKCISMCWTWNIFFQVERGQRRGEEEGYRVNSAKKQVGNEKKKTIYNTTPRPDHQTIETFWRLDLEKDSVWARLWSPADCLASLSFIIRAAAKAMAQLLSVLSYSLLITRNCYNVLPPQYTTQFKL